MHKYFENYFFLTRYSNLRNAESRKDFPFQDMKRPQSNSDLLILPATHYHFTKGDERKTIETERSYSIFKILFNSYSLVIIFVSNLLSYEKHLWWNNTFDFFSLDKEWVVLDLTWDFIHKIRITLRGLCKLS